MDDDERNASPLDEAQEEIAAELAEDSAELITVLSHYYRGEVSQANNAQNRIDLTTNWAITILAALLSVVFASLDVPASLLLIGMVILCIFLVYEIRRYQLYDLYRARVRFFQENVFANALEPKGAEHPEWREELGEDLRYPTFKVSTREALARRIRRIYGLLFAVLGVAWVAKVTLLTSEPRWTDAAAISVIPGSYVALILGVFFLGVGLIALWPSDRQAKGEIYGKEPGEWKRE